MKVFGTHTHIHKIGKKYTLFLHGSLGGGFLLPLPKPYSLCPQQTPRLFVVLCLAAWPTPSFLKVLGH